MATFQWTDALNLESQLSEDEVAMRYAQASAARAECYSAALQLSQPHAGRLGTDAAPERVPGTTCATTARSGSCRACSRPTATRVGPFHARTDCDLSELNGRLPLPSLAPPPGGPRPRGSV